MRGYPIDVPDSPDVRGHDDPVTVLQRWQSSGGAWRVAFRTPTRLDIELLTCSRDEVMGIVTSADPALLEFVGDRDDSEDGDEP